MVFACLIPRCPVLTGLAGMFSDIRVRIDCLTSIVIPWRILRYRGSRRLRCPRVRECPDRLSFIVQRHRSWLDVLTTIGSMCRKKRPFGFERNRTTIGSKHRNQRRFACRRYTRRGVRHPVRGVREEPKRGRFRVARHFHGARGCHFRWWRPFGSVVRLLILPSSPPGISASANAPPLHSSARVRREIDWRILVHYCPDDFRRCKRD